MAWIIICYVQPLKVSPMNLVNVVVQNLIPTEKILSDNIEKVTNYIGIDPSKWPPIIISPELYILDGHHRREIALRLSFDVIPAFCVSYFDPKIKVYDYNDGTPLDKTTLLKIYQYGVVLNPKTTRHIFEQ